jgi:DNA-binding CsgD family transcriptional regulator
LERTGDEDQVLIGSAAPGCSIFLFACKFPADSAKVSAFAMPPESVPPGKVLGLGILTPREREVVDWLGEGKSNWSIGQILGCSEETVKKHLQRAYRKLGVETRMEAANFLRSGAH